MIRAESNKPQSSRNFVAEKRDFHSICLSSSYSSLTHWRSAPMSAEGNCRPNTIAERLRHPSLLETPRNPADDNRSESILISPPGRRGSLNSAAGGEHTFGDFRRSRLRSLAELFGGRKTARRARSFNRQFSSDMSDAEGAEEDNDGGRAAVLPRFSHSVERLRESWKPVVCSNASLIDSTFLSTKRFQSNYTWRRSDGLEFCLTGISLEQLGEVERQILQKIALNRLQKSSLGCTITRPKGMTSLQIN